jgi:uncharacterized spore protein YtfJ
MGIESVIGQARDVVTVKRVFGDPYERDGITVIPAAIVRGGAGGGEGQAQGGDGEKGSGGGFGMAAKPAGVYIIKDGSVRWRPAVDINRIVLGGQVVAIIAILTRSRVAAMMSARSRRPRSARGRRSRLIGAGRELYSRAARLPSPRRLFRSA